MDKELITYLDARFKETAQQIAASREETAQQIADFRGETSWRFEQVDKRFEQMDSRLGQFDDRFGQLEDRLEKSEDTARQTGILLESLRHQVHLVAEVVLGINERLERYHREAMIEFDRIIGLIEPYYRDLDSRVSGLNGRVHVLEGRAERQQGDVMDAIRKLLGKTPLSPPATSE